MGFLRPIIFFIGLFFTIYLAYAYFSGFFQYTEPGIFAATAMAIAEWTRYPDPAKIGTFIEILAFAMGIGMILYGWIGESD